MYIIGVVVPKPDLDTYVFCRAKEDIGTLEVDAEFVLNVRLMSAYELMYTTDQIIMVCFCSTEAEVEMEQGNVFIIPYRVVANYVYSGAVDLL
jgi:hypothetical protein